MGIMSTALEPCWASQHLALFLRSLMMVNSSMAHVTTSNMMMRTSCATSSWRVTGSEGTFKCWAGHLSHDKEDSFLPYSVSSFISLFLMLITLLKLFIPSPLLFKVLTFTPPSQIDPSCSGSLVVAVTSCSRTL